MGQPRLDIESSGYIRGTKVLTRLLSEKAVEPYIVKKTPDKQSGNNHPETGDSDAILHNTVPG